MIAPVTPAWFILRSLAIVLCVSVSAVLVVDGILVSKLGEGIPLTGRVQAISPHDGVGTVDFTYVTFAGHERSHYCDVPAGQLAGLAPGRPVEIHARVGLRGLYACSAAGLPALRAKGIRSIWWGSLAGGVALTMLIALLYDLWTRHRRAR
jgi:hypothetical protein